MSSRSVLAKHASRSITTQQWFGCGRLASSRSVFAVVAELILVLCTLASYYPG